MKNVELWNDFGNEYCMVRNDREHIEPPKALQSLSLFHRTPFTRGNWILNIRDLAKMSVTLKYVEGTVTAEGVDEAIKQEHARLAGLINS